MREIEDLCTNRQRLGKIAPVVWRSIGHFDDPSIRTADQGPQHRSGELALEGGFVALRHPRHATGAQTFSTTVVIGHCGTAHRLLPRRATGRLALDARLLALSLALAIFHGGHHPIE
jgi:hypothetical protein